MKEISCSNDQLTLSDILNIMWENYYTDLNMKNNICFKEGLNLDCLEVLLMVVPIIQSVVQLKAIISRGTDFTRDFDENKASVTQVICSQLV